MTTTAQLDPPAVSVDPGDEQHVTVHIRNDGDVVEAYRLDVIGAAADWAALEPTTLSIFPGSTETAVLTFRPPRSHQLTSGELPYAVRVLPTEHPHAATVPEGTVRVLPFHELQTQLLPRSAEGRRRARSQVELENRGNTSASVLLTATDPAEKLRHAFKPAALTLRPGERVYAGLTVRSRKRLWRGRAKAHPFQVQVGSGGEDGSQPTVLTGTYEQLPLIPGWLFGAAGLLAALVAFWFALVRPTVQSAARQSVTAQVKQAVQEAVGPSAAAASAGPHSPTGGSSPTPGPHGGVANGGASPGTTPGAGSSADAGAIAADAAQGQYSTRINTTVDPGTQGSKSYQTPGDHLWLITDIEADAPQGDEGTLTVTVDGQEVVSLALENIRYRDKPFVTPIQAPPKSRIVLSVNCRKPGTPPDASPSTACVESVFVSGSLVAPPAPTASGSAH